MDSSSFHFLGRGICECAYSGEFRLFLVFWLMYYKCALFEKSVTREHLVQVRERLRVPFSVFSGILISFFKCEEIRGWLWFLGRGR